MNKMKFTKIKMKNRFIFISITSIIIACCCISCEPPVSEELHILIQNRTNSPINISLYPNDKYLTPLDGFVATDVGGGGRDTEFTLSPNEGDRIEWSEIIFITRDLNIKPYTLAAKVFDSIHIGTANTDKVIKFTRENVIGYSENIFSDNSTWDFIIGGYDRSDFKVRMVKAYQYRFLILEDKIIIE